MRSFNFSSIIVAVVAAAFGLFNVYLMVEVVVRLFSHT